MPRYAYVVMSGLFYSEMKETKLSATLQHRRHTPYILLHSCACLHTVKKLEMLLNLAIVDCFIMYNNVPIRSYKNYNEQLQ